MKYHSQITFWEYTQKWRHSRQGKTRAFAVTAFSGRESQSWILRHPEACWDHFQTFQLRTLSWRMQDWQLKPFIRIAIRMVFDKETIFISSVPLIVVFRVIPARDSESIDVCPSSVLFNVRRNWHKLAHAYVNGVQMVCTIHAFQLSNDSPEFLTRIQLFVSKFFFHNMDICDWVFFWIHELRGSITFRQIWRKISLFTMLKIFALSFDL